MKEFLSKFLPAEKVQEILDAYKAKNTDATDLPTYIPKKRLDEVIAKRDEIKAALEAIPADWKTKLDDLQDSLTKEQGARAKAEANAAAFQADLSLSDKLHKVNARNFTAVKALIDPKKPVDEEIARLQKDEAYLFGAAKPPLPKGTGKGGDGDKEEPPAFDMNKARVAMGLPEQVK